MRVLVVFTGGTIGSRATPGAIDVVAGQTRALLAAYAERPDRLGVEFEVTQPINILSENAKPDDWDQIVRSIVERSDGGFDGVVVTHGTDTLAFAASALSFALAGHVSVPVVLVASNQPLDDPLANGGDNFADALRLIRDRSGSGTYVTYVNPDGEHLIHRGARLNAATPLDHFFTSLARSEFGCYHGEQLEVREAASDERPAATNGAPAGSFAEHAGKVILVQPYPGLDYSRLDVTGLRAVVHELYHSGTACVDPDRDELSLLHLAARCRDRDIPLFVVPWPGTTSIYESSREMFEAGVLTIARMAAGAAYAKTLWGLSLGLEGDALKSYVTEREIAHEFVNV